MRTMMSFRCMAPRLYSQARYELVLLEIGCSVYQLADTLRQAGLVVTNVVSVCVAHDLIGCKEKHTTSVTPRLATRTLARYRTMLRWIRFNLIGHISSLPKALQT